MRPIRNLQALRAHLKSFGLRKTALKVLDVAINSVAYFDCIHVVVLDRNRVTAPAVVDQEPIHFRLATHEDLQAMTTSPELQIREDKLKNFLEGDDCLLQFVGDELAGYAWAHTRGMPQLFPGLRLRIPSTYLYNYAALTLPKFRGRNHQAMRHHELLQRPQWKHFAGLMGYVRYTNWSSRSGLPKSGYRDIGRIWLAGTSKHFVVWIPDHLRKLGIARVPTEQGPITPVYPPAPVTPLPKVAARSAAEAA